MPAGESVRGLIERIRAVLKSSLGADLVLHGVVTGFRNSGYFDLQDEKDQRLSVSASYYGREEVLTPLAEAGFPVQDGLPVMLRGYATLSNARAQVRFIITGVVPQYTRSILKSRRDETNERLAKEGVFERQRQLAFPLLPRGLGIVTSERGVVFEDLRRALAAAAFRFDYVWIRCAVQGPEAVRDIPRAITELARHPRVGVICLFRGGGSAMDLDAFNTYEIARSICDCPKPVLCAIGHRNDECSAQDVAFRNCHTPSLLGEFLASRIEGLRQRVTGWVEIVARRMREAQR
ncbi:MAG: exodeoxyribonuclease VII large subunit, partial [Opitutaceae bacterium]|nr:exodeoxyribonuclease VII large subunit [Opitutaceae bacterium]